MEGIIVVSEEIMTEVPAWCFIVYFIIPVVVFTISLFFSDGYYPFVITALFILTFTVMWPVICETTFSVPTGEVRQQIVISEPVNVIDFYKKYDVLEYDGITFTVVEKSEGDYDGR